MDRALDMLMTMRYTNLRFIIIIIISLCPTVRDDEVALRC